MSDPLIIAGREFGSRLFLGTAGYPNRKLMLDSIAASGTAMVTASIRRISLAGDDESLLDLLAGRVRFLPNTAVSKARDPVMMATSMRAAVDAGRLSRLAGRIPKLAHAEPSSPQFGLVGT